MFCDQISQNKKKSPNLWHVTSILVCCIFGYNQMTLVQLCSPQCLWVAIAILEQKAKGRASKLWGIRNNYASIWLHQRAFRYSLGLIYGEHFSWFWCIQISGQGVTIMQLDCTKAFDKICHIMTFFVPSIIHNGY